MGPATKKLKYRHGVSCKTPKSVYRETKKLSSRWSKWKRKMRRDPIFFGSQPLSVISGQVARTGTMKVDIPRGWTTWALEKIRSANWPRKMFCLCWFVALGTLSITEDLVASSCMRSKSWGVKTRCLCYTMNPKLDHIRVCIAHLADTDGTGWKQTTQDYRYLLSLWNSFWES